MSTATPADDATPPRLNPLPRVVSGGPRGLPQPLTPLIGRERDVAHVATQLRTGEVRLLTLIGPGGVGKTRLAIEVAREVAGHFAAGAVFIPLAPVSQTDLVASALVRALEVREVGGRSAADLLKEELRGRELLLVLDNFEQVAAAAPLVTDLLQSCPRLVILVTSRARLQVSGERVIVVPPLALPDRASPPAVERLPDYPAIRLFLDRAQAAGGDVALTEANADAIVEICRRLDGLPLAIELAAARSNVLTPPALLARLTTRLPLLTGGPQDAPARLRTMGDAIAWSYDLLSPDEQTLFRRLAVFVGGFTLSAAEAIGGEAARREGGDCRHSLPPSRLAASPPDVLDGITSLVGKSLLRPREQPEGEPRFVMLETIREYGLERLEISGETELVGERHADWCVSLAETARAAYDGPAEAAWMDQLEAEHDNLRAALARTLNRAEVERALRLVIALRSFWFLRGYLGEGRRWIEQALALGADASLPIRAEATYGAGAIAYHQGDHVQAGEIGAALLAASRAEEHMPGILRGLFLLGMVAHDRGELEPAATLFAEALTVARGLHDRHWIALTLSDLGTVIHEQGDFDRAIALLEEAHAIWREMESSWGLAVAGFNLAAIARSQGDHRRAASLHRTSLALRRDQRDRWGIAESLAGIAGVAGVCGRTEQAARLIGAVAALHDATGGTLSRDVRVTYDGDVDAARAALGERAFATAWEAGQALSLEQAIDEATALVGDLAAPSDPSRSRVSVAEMLRLTPRELEVLRLLVEGTSDREIGEALGISHRTVETHVTSLLNKLGVTTRTAAAAAAVRQGLA